MKTKNLLQLLGWLVICQVPGILGMQYVFTNMTWYRSLVHPAFTPPDALFGLVWSVLYLMLGTSAFLTFNDKLHARALLLFVLQLVLNACWTPVFFGAHSLFGALILIIAMFISLIFLIKACHQINRIAAWLLVPYGLWLLFATYLTAANWWLN